MVGAGVFQPCWSGYGHILPGWSSDWHMVQLKVFIVLPTPFESVMKTTLLMVCLHSLMISSFLKGGNI